MGTSRIDGADEEREILSLASFRAGDNDTRPLLRLPFLMEDESDVVVATDGRWMAWKRFQSLCVVQERPANWLRPDARKMMRRWRKPSRKLEVDFSGRSISRMVGCRGDSCWDGECRCPDCEDLHTCKKCGGRGLVENREMMPFAGRETSCWRLAMLVDAEAMVGDPVECDYGALLPFAVDGLKGVLWLSDVEAPAKAEG